MDWHVRETENEYVRQQRAAEALQILISDTIANAAEGDFQEFITESFVHSEAFTALYEAVNACACMRCPLCALRSQYYEHLKFLATKGLI